MTVMRKSALSRMLSTLVMPRRTAAGFLLPWKPGWFWSLSLSTTSCMTALLVMICCWEL